MDKVKLIDLQGLQTYDEKLEAEKLTAMKSDIKKNTDAIGDITKLNTTAKTDIITAINEVKSTVGTQAGAITIETTNTTTGVLKSYTVKQGDAVIGVIDIPKDMVVAEGSVVVDPEGQESGTYIKFVIANQDEPLYINVGTLVDIYKAHENATQIQLTINSSTREISATIVSGAVGTTELSDDAVTTVKIADANVTLAKLAVDVMNAFDTSGSATAAEGNAKKYADGLNTAMDARVKSVEDKIGDGFEIATALDIEMLFK